MATHGNLWIRARQGNKSWIKLKTFHTAMDIPLAVEEAVRVHQKAWQRNFDLMEERYVIEPRNSLEADINAGFYYTHFGYPPAVAALVISAIPCFLQPVIGSYVKHGYGPNDAHKLIVEDDRWVLHHEDDNHVLLDFNPIDRLCDLFMLSKLQ